MCFKPRGDSSSHLVHQRFAFFSQKGQNPPEVSFKKCSWEIRCRSQGPTRTNSPRFVSESILAGVGNSPQAHKQCTLFTGLKRRWSRCVSGGSLAATLVLLSLFISAKSSGGGSLPCRLCGCYAVSDDPFRAEREGALRGTDVGAAVGGSGAEFKTSNPNVIPLLKRQAFNSQQVREDQ